MISQKYRFHGHASLKYVFNNGQISRGGNLSIKFVDNNRRRYSRVAIIVSKKVFKHAVDRNRVRRRIYEIMRQRLPHFNRTVDVVITVYRAEVRNMPVVELAAEIDHGLKRPGIIS